MKLIICSLLSARCVLARLIDKFKNIIFSVTYLGPYGAPRSVVTSVTGTTTASVAWSDPDPDLQNGIIVYYTILLVDVMFETPDRLYNTTLTSFNFSGLEEYARYSVLIAAVTVGGAGPFSTAVNFTTREASELVE